MGIAQTVERVKFSAQQKFAEAVFPFLPTRVQAKLAGLGDPPRFSLGLSNSEITSALLVAERGDNYRAWALFRDMFSRNLHLQAEVGKRIMAFLGQKEQILPFDSDNADDVIAAEVCTDMANACENWLEGLTHLALGHIWPISGAEKIYEPITEETQRLFRHPVSFRLKKLHPIPWPLYTYRVSYQNVNIAATPGPTSAVPQPTVTGDGAIPNYGTNPNDISLVNAGRKDTNPALIWNPDDWHPDLRFYDTFPTGLINWSLSACYKPDPTRHILHSGGVATTSMRDNWSANLAAMLFWHLLMLNARDGFGRAMERYGSPFAVAYARLNDKPVSDALIEAFQRATNIGALIVPPQAKVQLEQAMYSGMADGWSKLINLCKSEITTGILGQCSSTEAKTTGQGSGVSDLHGEVRSDWIQNDSLQFGTMELQQLYGPFLKINGFKGRIQAPIRGGLSDEGKAALSKVMASNATAGIFPDVSEEANLSRKFGFKVKIYTPQEMAAINKPPVTAKETGGNTHHT